MQKGSFLSKNVQIHQRKKNKYNNLDFSADPRWQLDEKAKFLKGAGLKL